MEIPEKIWFLMSRSLSGEATPEEQAELQQELRQQPVLMQQYELMKRMWEGYAGWQTEGPADEARVSRILQLSAAEDVLRAPKAPGNFTTEDTEVGSQRDTEAFASFSRLRDTKGAGGARSIRVRSWKKVYGRAAIAAGLATGLWALAQWYMDGRHTINKSEIVAERGSKTRTILPDGSTVWLNAGSRIRYDAGFNGPTREVSLQGEAFFDVAQHPSRPFIVHAGELTIRVLGTAFNVKSYDEDTTVETTLIRGLVQITRPGDVHGAPIYLHPHEKIVLPRKEDAGAPAAVAVTRGRPSVESRPHIVAIDSSMKEDERVETSWVYNRLEFRGDSFEQLARKLERWYNIEIHFEDDAMRGLTFNGSLENETVEQAFQALEAAVPFRFTIKDNEVYIQSASTEKKQ